jgi:glycosyltransferase involved in cell wall biosynthesis
VHSHTSLGGFMGRVASRLATRKPKVFHTLHAYGADEFTPQPQKAVFASIERWLDKFTDVYIAPSQYIASYGVRLGLISSDRVYVVPNSIPLSPVPTSAAVLRLRGELRSQLKVADDAVVILFCGRLERQKGVDVLLKALSRLDSNRPWILVVCGDGNLRAHLAKLALRLGIGERVRWMGWQSNLANFYAAADIYAMASRWESFGLVFLEAMHYGLPIVACNVQAVPEVVTHGKTGRLSASEDPEELAINLAMLIGNEDRRRELGEAGRNDVVDRFGFERFVDSHLSLYRRSLGWS